MSDDWARRLAQLRQAYENGTLDEDAFQAAVSALGPKAEVEAKLEGSGSIAQREGVAAGAMGVAIGRDVHGDVIVIADRAGTIIDNLSEAVESLKASVPAGDEALSSLVQSLRDFADFHEVIDEWKELHNLLQELLNDLHPFMAEVDRLYVGKEPPHRERLRQGWRQCERRMRRLLDFAKGIRYISSEPYQEEGGQLRGPDWAVEAVGGQVVVKGILEEKVVDIESLYESTGELLDTCDTHLYRADKNLHDKTEELCIVSRGLLARIGQ